MIAARPPSNQPLDKPLRPARPHLLLSRPVPWGVDCEGAISGSDVQDVWILAKVGMIPSLGGNKVPRNGRRWIGTKSLRILDDEKALCRCVLAIHEFGLERTQSKSDRNNQQKEKAV